MTTLTKPRTFKMLWISTAGSSRDASKPLIVRLDPAGIISFREPHKRHWLDFPLARVYHLAALASADEIRLSRKTRRNS